MAMQPMTYLQLVKRLVQELGTELPEKVTSVTNTPATSYGTTTQHINDCVTWTNQAWIELQEDQQDWDFLRKQGTFPLVGGQPQYDIILQTGMEDYDGLRPYMATLDRRYIWVTNSTSQPASRHNCYYVKPEQWFGLFGKNPPAKGLPTRYSFTSNGCILFYPYPSTDSMTAEFRYQRGVQELVEDTDTPLGLPPKYHLDIVYRAMEYYSGYDETQPQWKRAVTRKRKMENKMYIELLPEYSAPGVR